MRLRRDKLNRPRPDLCPKCGRRGRVMSKYGGLSWWGHEWKTYQEIDEHDASGAYFEWCVYR